MTLGGGGAVAYNAQGMARLVFDIETSAVGLEHFDEGIPAFRKMIREMVEEAGAQA